MIDLKLKKKLILNYLAAALITMFLVGFAVLRGIQILSISTMEKQLIDQSNLAEIYISQIHILDNGDSPVISSNTTRSVISKLGLVMGNVHIYDNNLVLLASAKENTKDEITDIENGQVLSAALKGDYAYMIRKGTVFFSSPINVDDTIIGLLEIIYPMSFLQKLVTEVTNILLMGAFVFVIIITLLSAYIAGRLTKPINKLADAAKNYAERVFDPVEIKGSDEISQLSKSFNQMGAQLQDYIQRQKLFISNVSHELRTPLTAIKGYSEILADELENRPDLKKAVYHLNNESSRLAKLVEEVLALSRIDTGSESFHFSRLDFSLLVAETTEKMQLRAEKYQIKTIIDIEPDINIFGDEEKLIQVIVNLLDNAFKFSPKNSSVWVNVRAYENTALLAISDQGIGIPKGDSEKVFERFYRAENAGCISGTGLGLSIVKYIIDAHKGSINLEAGSNGGTTASMRLPLQK